MPLVNCLNRIKLALRSGRVVFFLIASIWGCAPTCEQVCEKLTTCEQLDSSTSEKDCESACTAQELLFDDWEDEEKRLAFEEMKICIGENECGDIIDGVCYDESVYRF